MTLSDFVCPVCDRKHHQPLYQLERGQLATCKTCQTVNFFPKPTPQELVDFYEGGYHDSFSQSAMADQEFAQHRYQSLITSLEQYDCLLSKHSNRLLLDVGCGTGDFLAVAQQDGWQVLGTELAHGAVARARQKLGDCVVQGEITELDLPKGHYPLITSYHVVEHLLDPVGQLKQCYELLANDGVLFVETPNIKSLGARLRQEKWSHIIPPEHIIYFSPTALKYTMQQAGFKRVWVFTSAPKVIESIDHWSPPIKSIVTGIYQLAPRLGFGAAVQAIGVKDEG